MRLLTIIILSNLLFGIDSEITINSSDFNSWKYFSFGSGELIEVDIENPEMSLLWDIAVMRNHFKTNSGLSGPGFGGSAVDSTETYNSDNWSKLYFSGDLVFSPDNILENLIYDIVTHTMSSQPGSTILETWGWFDYDNNYQFNVNHFKYFVRTADGSKILKFWIQDYYNDLGQSAHISLRYSDQIGCFLDNCGVCNGISSTCEGCMDESACNYDDSALIDNGCIYSETNFDCFGNCLADIDCYGICGGLSILDDCEICGGDNSICSDCNGQPDGIATEDMCGTCNSDSSDDCIQDCAGEWGGNTIEDECGVCGGDNTTCKDCNDEVNGTAYIDGCGSCVGGSTGFFACSTDCNGVEGGSAFINNCGHCVEDGDASCIQGCDGKYSDDGTHLIEDECGVCDGNGLTCQDCMGVVNGNSIIDNCGICVDADDISCLQGCDGYYANDGTHLVEDDCGVCGGNNLSCLSNNENIPNLITINNIYPNPFNPVVNINYSMSSSNNISIRIFNLSGFLIEELFSGFQTIGTYSISWNASMMSSGTYIIFLESEKNKISEQIILIK